MPPTPMPEAPAPMPDPMRVRLLDAAASCFAARGYTGTTVRHITTRAGCNVGALNYHFGSKHNAYVAVFEERLSALTRRRIEALEALAPQPELEQVIETFAVAFLDPLRSGAHGQETMSLLLREMVDGHLPASLVAERMVRPTIGALIDALDRACAGLEPRSLVLCCHSLISQLVHVLQVQRLHERGRAGTLPQLDIADTVAHIVRFTAAGVRSCRTVSA